MFDAIHVLMKLGNSAYGSPHHVPLSLATSLIALLPGLAIADNAG